MKMIARSAKTPVSATAAMSACAAGLFVLAIGQPARAAPIVLNFDSLPAMPNVIEPIPAADQLSNLYLSTFGVSFASGSPYVAVVDLGVGHAPSPPNAIGGSTPTGNLTYSSTYPITATFFNPSNPSEDAVTDFVSLTGDLQGSAQDVTLNGYDINGNLIASDTTADVGGEILSISTPGIHSIQFHDSRTDDLFGVGVDNFTFDPVTTTVPPVPEPASLALLASGLTGLMFIRRRRRT